jgi:hypothetical protein
MSRPIVIPHGSFNPAHMLDHLRYRLRLKNDASLSRLLDVTPFLLSRIRHRKRSVCAGLMVRIHEATGIRVHDLRVMMGDRRQRTRPGLRQRGATAKPLH